MTKKIIYLNVHISKGTRTYSINYILTLSYLNTPREFFYALFSRVHCANGTKQKNSIFSIKLYQKLIFFYILKLYCHAKKGIVCFLQVFSLINPIFSTKIKILAPLHCDMEKLEILKIFSNFGLIKKIKVDLPSLSYICWLEIVFKLPLPIQSKFWKICHQNLNGTDLAWMTPSC